MLRIVPIHQIVHRKDVAHPLAVIFELLRCFFYRKAPVPEAGSFKRHEAFAERSALRIDHECLHIRIIFCEHAQSYTRGIAGTADAARHTDVNEVAAGLCLLLEIFQIALRRDLRGGHPRPVFQAAVVGFAVKILYCFTAQVLPVDMIIERDHLEPVFIRHEFRQIPRGIGYHCKCHDINLLICSYHTNFRAKVQVKN